MGKNRHLFFGWVTIAGATNSPSFAEYPRVHSVAGPILSGTIFDC